MVEGGTELIMIRLPDTIFYDDFKAIFPMSEFLKNADKTQNIVLLSVVGSLRLLSRSSKTIYNKKGLTT